MFIKTIQKCSFLSIPQVDAFKLMWWTWVHEDQGQDLMEEIGCFAGLESRATKP